MAGVRRRSRGDEILDAHRHQSRQRRDACAGVGVGDGRDAEDRAAHASRKFPGDAAHDRRHAVSQHVVQSRRRARREHRHASCGRTIRKAYLAGQPPNGTGFVHRGVATWTDGKQRRIFINSRWNLIALDARRDRPIRDFGDTGVVDLTRESRAQRQAGQQAALHRRRRRRSSGAISSSSATASPTSSSTRTIRRATCRRSTSKSGKRAWSFSPVPRDSRDEAPTRGRTNRGGRRATRTCGRRSASTIARGLVYLPVSTPSNDWYGGARKGNNLFAESIVCLDAKNGKHKSGTSRRCITVSGTTTFPRLQCSRRCSVDGQAARHRRRARRRWDFCSCSIASTGKPIWPIEERVGAGERRARRAGGAVAAVSHEAEAIRQAGIRLQRPDRLHAGDQSARARRDQGLSRRPALHAAVDRAERS